ncbi:hypothetical protein SDC9_156937 [bioreactor metagenome]|uniref:Uncharacterized protein n=1 Tax=bioreactor metagenome TaxID=1076179 RepID=A0A645F7M0_9ZZZZ
MLDQRNQPEHQPTDDRQHDQLALAAPTVDLTRRVVVRGDFRGDCVPSEDEIDHHANEAEEADDCFEEIEGVAFNLDRFFHEFLLAREILRPLRTMLARSRGKRKICRNKKRHAKSRAFVCINTALRDHISRARGTAEPPDRP